MLLKAIKAEALKLKRAPVWLAFVFMPVIPAILGTLNYSFNLEILKSLWYSLWTQHTLFTDYFFMPAMLGVYCAYIIHQEENNHNWNRVLTLPVGRAAVFTAKAVIGWLMVALTMLWVCTLYVIGGKLAGITAAVPWGSLALWWAGGCLGGMVMVSLQLLIALITRGFALPVGIALGGGISGLYFLVKKLGHIYPYSLMAYGMNANAPQRAETWGQYLLFALICLIYIVLFTGAGSLILNKRDV